MSIVVGLLGDSPPVVGVPFGVPQMVDAHRLSLMSRGKSSKRRRNRAPSTPLWKLVALGCMAIVAVGLVSFALGARPAPASTYVKPPQAAASETPAPAVKPVVAFLGDSYTAGTGATTEKARWVDQSGTALAWSVQNLGRGGTGYASGVTGETAPTACGLDYCPSYIEMIPEAQAAAPKVVVVAGGRNEYRLDAEEESDNIVEFYSALRAALPDAKIVAVSAVWDDDTAPESIAPMNEAIRSAAASVGGVFVDIGEPLLGNADLIAADGTHPNDAGHAALAAAFVDAFNTLP